MFVCCEKSVSGHRDLQMESKMDDGWNIGMPVLLDCLRKDIRTNISQHSSSLHINRLCSLQSLHIVAHIVDCHDRLPHHFLVLCLYPSFAFHTAT